MAQSRDSLPVSTQDYGLNGTEEQSNHMPWPWLTRQDPRSSLPVIRACMIGTVEMPFGVHPGFIHCVEMSTRTS